LSDEPLARTIFQLSEGLIGEIVAIVSAAAAAAVRSGAERITKSGLKALNYIPVSKRRRAPVRDGLL
ncbi:NTP-binding protein, partial [Mesorhizobium sp. M2A.F.Ca.ET.037.01.1.1]